MGRMTFRVDVELLERVRQRARERGVSAAQVIREALERELIGERQPPLSFIGVMSSGRGDLSARASEDEYEPPPWRS